MRTLASIQQITSLAPIEGADRIEVATVLGWHVVVEKGLYQVGSLVIYCEIDSFLPPHPAFNFLAKSGTKKMVFPGGQEVEGYRIRTARLRGQISQGIVFPLSILPQLPLFPLEEGVDVTEQLGICKYDVPLSPQLAGIVRAPFPAFLPKTDEPRIQAYPHLLTRYHDIPFYVTEKLDGSSCTFFLQEGEVHVCSRNLDLLDDGKHTLWRLSKELQIEEKLQRFEGAMHYKGKSLVRVSRATGFV